MGSDLSSTLPNAWTWLTRREESVCQTIWLIVNSRVPVDHCSVPVLSVAVSQSAILLLQVVCLAVCPSVTLRYHDHIDWKSSKIISRLVSMCSFSADPNITDLLQNEHHKILTQSDLPHVELSVAGIRWQITAEWLQRSGHNGEPYLGTTISLFQMVRSMTPYNLPFPKMVSQWPPRYVDCRMSISPQRVILSTWFSPRVWFSRSADRLALFPIR